MNDVVHNNRNAPESSSQNNASALPLPDSESINLALQAGHVGAWSWDIKNDELRWSGNVAEIHGKAPKDFNGTFASFQSLIHPEDQPEVIAAIQESVRNR